MPKFKVPITFYIDADDERQASHWAAMIPRNLPLDRYPTADIGCIELVPEVMDPSKDDFRNGYADTIVWFSDDPKERLKQAKTLARGIQGAQNNYNYDYGRLKACQEVLDQERRENAGKTGFGADPDAALKRIQEEGF